MQKTPHFRIQSRALITCLAVLASCQPLLAGGDASSFNAKPLDPWKKSCVADMYYIVPTRAGTNLPYLVFTNTCRSTHGCEACLMFGGDSEANFSPFDWSIYYDTNGAGNSYAKQVNLPTDNPQYLTNRRDQFGVMRQMLHVRNGTYYLGPSNGLYRFQNRIDLFDFQRGDWDVFYSRTFSATSEAQAASWRGLADSLAWMPMVETFGYYANLMTAVLGCDLARFFYDDQCMWQTPDNTSATLAPVGQTRWLGTNPDTGVDDWWRTLSYAPNTHFTVCMTTSNNQVTVAPPMGTLCVTANTNAGGFTLSTTNCTIDPFWVSTPDGKWWDKTVGQLSPGYYRITFTPVAGQSTPPEQIFRITENNITTVQAVYGGTAPNTPIAVLTNPVDQQTLWGSSLAATAIVAAGTPPYTVTYFTKPAGGTFTQAGTSTVAPYSVSLASLPIGTYTIYATVTDSAPVPVTGTSASATFIVAPTVTWSNSATSGNWSNPLSWDGGAVPVSGATVVFGTAGSTSVVDAANRTVSSVLFNRGANFTLSNSGSYGLTINNNITASNSFTNTITAPVTLGAANIWTVNDGSTLQVSGAVGGNSGLTKAGAGTLTLTASNSFKGGVNLKAGTLVLGSGSSLGIGPLTIDGGYISSNGSQLTMPNNNPVVVNGSFTWTGEGGFNWNMGSGAVTLNNSVSVYVGNTLTIGGAISGPGGLNALDIAFKNMVGAGFGVELNAPVTLRGDQTVPGSGENFNAAIGDGGHGYAVNVAVSDVWGGWGGKVGFKAANTYSGDTTVSSGLLTLGHNLALQYSALNTAAGIAALSVTSPTLGGLKGSSDLASVFTTGYGSVSALTLNPQGGTCTYTGAIANGASGMTLTKTGNGTQVLGGNNSYSGVTSVNAGTLVLDGANTGGGAITVKSGARLGGGGSTTSAVTVQSGGKWLANISDWEAGTCGNLTVSTLTLPTTWSLNISAAGFTETDKTFRFLTATGAINGFNVPTLTGPGAGTWLVRKNPSDAKVLELVYTAAHGAATTLELNSSLNPSPPGQSVTFTATVKAGSSTATSATGTCTFKVDGTVVATVPITAGAANYSTSSLTTGSHVIMATYSGDASYAYSSASRTQACGNLIVPTYTTRGDGKTVATFTSGSGLWPLPLGVSSVEVLVVGGGGGCSDDNFQSGCGAGGMVFNNSYAMVAGSVVDITVGTGAIQGTGGSSQFDALLAYGGTKGDGYTNGGDQGGYSIDRGTTTVAGNLGYHYSPMDGNWCSGGGAGQAGAKGDTKLGGAGASCNITGTAVYYAGGGGAPSSYSSSGGTGHNLGFGGTGPSVFGGRATSGAANSGGGGGGGWGGGGGSGGSGVVIVAYRAVTAPSAPAITGITPGNGTLTVAFTAPASDGGVAITNYKYSIDNGSTFTAVSPAAVTSPILISGLTIGTAYTVKILAVNAVGDGAPSPGVSGTPVGNYAAWASANGLSGGPSAVGKSGLPNLILYAVNTNPNNPGGSPGTLTGKVLSYGKRPEAVANGDVHYAIEVSADLGLAEKWTEVQSYITNDSSTISCTLPSNKTKVFARLSVRLGP